MFEVKKTLKSHKKSSDTEFHFFEDEDLEEDLLVNPAEWVIS